ncbi:MAG: hypothetical protein ACAH59_05500, partial [Pseudobdellovibrionaceae bacterium]
MNHLIIGLLLGLSLSVQAAQKSLNLDLATLQMKPISENKFGNFTKLTVQGFENTKEIGAPELPV